MKKDPEYKKNLFVIFETLKHFLHKSYYWKIHTIRVIRIDTATE